MAHRFPPLRVANVERPDNDTVILVVEHDAAQSYSRSVDPGAMRLVRPHLGGGSWTLTNTYDRGTTVPDAPIKLGTRCLRAYRFRDSAAHARDEQRAVVADVQADEPMREATAEQLAHLFGTAPEPAPANPPATVHVVNWDVNGVGGFEWRWNRADAETARADLGSDGSTVYLHTVELPADVAQLTNEEITDWLDDEGWSDGGDPRQQAA